MIYVKLVVCSSYHAWLAIDRDLGGVPSVRIFKPVFSSLPLRLNSVIDTAHLVLLISTLNNWFLMKFFNPAIPK